jgi:hypothetical protein
MLNNRWDSWKAMEDGMERDVTLVQQTGSMDERTPTAYSAIANFWLRYLILSNVSNAIRQRL